MKKVIDGKMYNTETATMITEYQSGVPGDYSYYYEELYITKKGNYFLFGDGGPLSPYSVAVGNNSFSGDSDINPMTKEEAFYWCQENRRTEAIEKHFSDLVEEA